MVNAINVTYTQHMMGILGVMPSSINSFLYISDWVYLLWHGEKVFIYAFVLNWNLYSKQTQQIKLAHTGKSLLAKVPLYMRQL